MSNFLSPIDENAWKQKQQSAQERTEKPSIPHEPASENPDQEIHKQRDAYLEDVMETLRGRGDFHCC